jgi:membrane fusion protein, hemolysin D
LSQDLVTARGQLDTAKAQYAKAVKHQDLVQLVAPEPSVVLSLSKLSVGSVLKQGDTLFTLMPLNAPVEAEIHINPRDIGFVRVGDKCMLRIDAFDFTEHGQAEGRVRWISEGTFSTNSETGQPIQPYYKARCSIDEANFINVPTNFRLMPGMTLTAGLKIGTRSAAMYVLGGLMRGYGEAMREP